MRAYLGPRLLEYLRVELRCPHADFAEPLVPLSGSFRRESRLAECWRDLHVVAQAVTLLPDWYPIGGRALLKMDPGPRLR